MREEVLRELGRLESVRCVTGSGVGRARFLSELARSRICLSPFGYGEVAWRDYEAVLSGSLLVKQDMSHVITEPDIFVSDRTYVPIRWDVSDMSDRIAEYLKDDVSRSDLACNAFDVLYRWASGLKFVDQVARLFPVI
jgi:hypothetical protein